MTDLEHIKKALEGVDTELGQDYPPSGYFQGACRDLIRELEALREAVREFGEMDVVSFSGITYSDKDGSVSDNPTTRNWRGMRDRILSRLNERIGKV